MLSPINTKKLSFSPLSLASIPFVRKGHKSFKGEFYNNYLNHKTHIIKVRKLPVPDPKYGNMKLNVHPFEHTGEYVKLPNGFETWNDSFNEIMDLSGNDIPALFGQRIESLVQHLRMVAHVVTSFPENEDNQELALLFTGVPYDDQIKAIQTGLSQSLQLFTRTRSNHSHQVHSHDLRDLEYGSRRGNRWDAEREFCARHLRCPEGDDDRLWCRRHRRFCEPVRLCRGQSHSEAPSHDHSSRYASRQSGVHLVERAPSGSPHTCPSCEQGACSV